MISKWKLIVFSLLLVVVFTACSSPPKEKKVVKPLTKDQVIQKLLQSNKQQALVPIQYEHREALVNGGETETKVRYQAENLYHTYENSNNSVSEVYSLPKEEYTKRTYGTEKTKWRYSPYPRNFKDDQEYLFLTKELNYPLPSFQLQLLQQIPTKNVQMNSSSGQIQLMINVTEEKKIRNLMQGYLSKYSTAIDPAEIQFTKYHVVITLDQKTLQLQSIHKEVLFQRGQDSIKNLFIKEKFQYHPLEKIIVPNAVKKEADEENPFKILQP